LSKIEFSSNGFRKKSDFKLISLLYCRESLGKKEKAYVGTPFSVNEEIRLKTSSLSLYNDNAKTAKKPQKILLQKM